MKTKKNNLAELFEFLAIPSISAQTEHKVDMAKACKWLIHKLTNLGFSADILPTEGHPVVYAEYYKNPKKPTVLIYGHYDVQSPDPLDQWVSDPFKPEVRSGNIYARGAADDKGQLFTWIVAIEELLKSNTSLPINIKFVIEGEEELGSEHFEEFVKDNKALLKADVCVISDSHSLSPKLPLICYGLRGLVYAEVKVQTMPKDVHSGLYGGNVLNPAIILAQIISKLKDKNQKITVPGFYNDVRKLKTKEIKALNNFPFTELEVKSETGASLVEGEKGLSIPVRAGARPTLDVNGIWGGYIGEGQKTIIPGEATAKISMRLVPFQNPDTIAIAFTKYVYSLAPKGAEVTVSILSKGTPIVMDLANPYFACAEKAFKKFFGTKPLYELSGGSISATTSLKMELGIDSILMGYGLPDDGLHSPNEKLSLAMFEMGVKTNKEFLLLASSNVK